MQKYRVCRDGQEEFVVCFFVNSFGRIGTIELEYDEEAAHVFEDLETAKRVRNELERDHLNSFEPYQKGPSWNLPEFFVICAETDDVVYPQFDENLKKWVTT